MILEQPLNIDLKKQADLLQLVPRLPLLTSEEAQWKNILVQHHRQPAWEMPENHANQHVVVVHYEREETTQVDRMINETRQKEILEYGSCVIVPANVTHQSTWNRETEFTLLILEPDYLAQIAYEKVNSDRVELIPQFAKHDPVISSIGFTLKTELETDGMGAKLYAESATTFLAAHLLRHYCIHPQSLKTYPNGLPKYKLKQTIEYIEQHLGEEISLEAIANHLNMSQYYFCHLFKQSMGVSPYQYVLRHRIDKAKQLLKQRKLTITDVALECGFANQTHFTKHFRKLTGTTPRAYREQ
ncbi:helix-turn-helix domain-containing protein [Aerosakkonemataceae cyanobacterium BLCC-F50]|uniref:Helix-turn-helix domain-containing protein n=1 Tax=Floridaenema flaviceps BLCC-F50 TaxID=3153642 RepID=A0ABV4XP82_9CYAN